MDEIKDRKIASHFKLYTHFVSLKTFMLIAHGRYVTVFNLLNLQKYHHF
jgi:hypothetical protein